jgi:hypothetical protein
MPDTPPTPRSPFGTPPPRVLVILPDQWPRALLRATLRERGYDAIGARSVASALRVPPHTPLRGPVEVIVLDQQALGDAAGEPGGAEAAALLDRYATAATVLLARASVRPPAVPRAWTRVLRRPVSVAEVAAAVEALRPLPPEARVPLE